MKNFYHFLMLLVNFALLAFTHSVYAQDKEQWNRIFEDGSLSDVILTPDEGYLLAGSRIIKLDAYGNQQWEKSLSANAASNSPDGGYLLGSYAEIVKIDENGNRLWEKPIGVGLIITTPDGGYLLGSGPDDPDYKVTRIDNYGNIQWDKTFGGHATDQLADITATPDGGYLLAGTSDSHASGGKSTPNKGGSDYWVVKIDKSGNKVWDKTFGGHADDRLRDVVTTPDGSFLLAGSSHSNASGDKSEDSRGYRTGSQSYDDYWIVKIDKHGNKQWDKTLGGDDGEYLNSVIATSDGGYLMAGISDSNASGDKSGYYNTVEEHGYNGWIIKVDQRGQKLWDESYHWGIRKIINTPDGGYLQAGTTPTSEENVTQDIWISKQKKRFFNGFDLVNADTDQDIITLIHGGDFPQTLYLQPLGNPRLSIRANPTSANVEADSVKMELTGPITKTQIDSQWPYTLFGDNPKADSNGIDYQGEYWKPGSYQLKATPYLDGKAGASLQINFYVEDAGRGNYLTLVNADTDRDITDFRESNHVINLTELGNAKLSFRANTPAGVDKVKFVLKGAFNHVHEDRQTPFALFGDAPKGDYEGRQWEPGQYTLTVTPYTKDRAGSSFTITFSVIGLGASSLTLVNADTDKDITTLREGSVIKLNELADAQLSIRYNTSTTNLDRVKFELIGAFNHEQEERYAPYALFGDEPKAAGGRTYTGRHWQAGEYTLKATPYLDGQAGTPYSVTFSVRKDAAATVDFFVLVNADTDQDISRLREGDVIDLSALGHPSLSIRANTTPINLDSIELSLSGPLSHHQTEHYWPYALFGDEPDGPRDYTGRDWPEGNYTLTATPYINDQKGATATISFSVAGSNRNARLAVYPVPATDVININYEGKEQQAQMMLLDFSGQSLLDLPLKGQTQLDMSTYTKGIYYIKVVDKQGVHLKRVVLE